MTGYRLACSEHPEINEVIDAPFGDVDGLAMSHGAIFHGDDFAACVTVSPAH